LREAEGRLIPTKSKRLMALRRVGSSSFYCGFQALAAMLPGRLAIQKRLARPGSIAVIAQLIGHVGVTAL
jgi:hypothetical protein